MPTYAYKCSGKHGEFETTQKMSDPPLKECPKCKEEGLPPAPPKRLISLSSFVLKGQNWAKDNYGGK